VQSFQVHERELDGRRSSNNDDFVSDTRDEKLVVPWPDFLEGLKSFHSLLGLRSVPPADCCRLLYRFDLGGNGRISTQAFQTALLTALDELPRSTKQRDLTKARMPAKLKVAIANGHRRPNVEAFTSSEAVHKLFAARAKTCQDSSSPKARTATFLRASANSHLARIRNLPISQLLRCVATSLYRSSMAGSKQHDSFMDVTREGVFFRPPRQALYQCVGEGDRTEAQATGAEDSF
jgi:hypothetical protein